MGTRPVTVSPTQTACPTGNDLTADVGTSDWRFSRRAVSFLG